MSASLRDVPLRGWCTTRAVGRSESGRSESGRSESGRSESGRSGVATGDPELRRPETGSSTDRGDGSAPSVAGRAQRIWASLRWYASGVLGGSKYEGYLSWHARHGDGPPLSEKEYWRHRTAHEERHPEGRCC